ncbi:PREDICTED: protein rolling stone [Drosophila arizonae]|uniref:Protein rolling stone n=1 Tax=Drosophila arizonae TaxID=7263 RepID=A0ABM1NQB5_DROAR|nr:PREDICTED: protein rolling stone [Drosophila arizonae]
MSEIVGTIYRQEPISFWSEFECKHFGCHHPAHEDFFKSQWQRSEKSYGFLIYRWFLAIVFGSIFLVHIIKYFGNGYWFIYFTHWGFTLCAVTTLTGALYVSTYHAAPARMTRQTALINSYWVSSITNLVISYAINILYWLTVFPYEKTGTRPLKVSMFFNIWSHVLPSLVNTIDHMIVAHPTRVFHFIYPVIFGMLYLLFAITYYCVGARDPLGRRFIYKVLDFSSKPLQGAVTVSMIICILMSLTLLQYFIYRMRVGIARKTKRLQ